MIPKTKIIPPPLRQRRVERPHLYDRLDAVLDRRLALVAAPAGYGKSSLVRAWLEQLPAGAGPLTAAWLSLDRGDDAVERFFAALIAALRLPATDEQCDLGQSTLAMLEQPRRPPTGVVATNLLNELQATSRQFVLVLDDYHMLKNQELHAALSLFVERLPAHVHLVILSRAEPPLPLWRLRAADDLVELRAADLRFDAVETATFFAEVMEFDLPDEAVSVLDRQLEGWIAGLQLAALAHRAAQAPTGWDSTELPAPKQSHIFDYLAREVLERQPAPTRRFLLVTAVVDRFSSSLCNALLRESVGAIENSRPMLQRLLDDNLFLVPLDEEGRWFRYHHLFHSFLRWELSHHEEGDCANVDRFLPNLDTLHARASRWFGENGHWDDAIHHALAAADVDRAASLVGQAISGLFRRGKLAAIRHYLELLPQEVILSHHNYCVGYAWVLTLGGELQRVEKYLHAAEKQLAILAQGPPPSFDLDAQRSNLALIRASVAQRHGDVATMTEIARRALNRLQESDTPDLSSLAAYTLGEAYAMGGRLQDAQQTLQQAVVYGETAGHRYLACSALSSLARLRRRQARLQEEQALYRRILKLAGDDKNEEPAITGSAVAGLGALAYEWNRLGEALELARRAVTLYEASGEATGIVRANVLLARTLLARARTGESDADAGHDALQTALSLAQGWQLPAELAWTMAWRARFLLRGRNAKAGLALARQALAELEMAGGDGSSFSSLRESVELTLVRAQLARGRSGVEAALPILDEWQAFAENQALSALKVETALLRAQAQHLSGNETEARRTLRQALMLAQPAGFVRLFIDEGPRLAAQLRDVREARSADGIEPYIRQLLKAGDEAWPGAAAMDTPQQALTERQCEVLSLMARGLSNREIAERLIISPETVRWHTKQIYRRLDVRNRTEAAAYARHFYQPAA